MILSVTALAVQITSCTQAQRSQCSDGNECVSKHKVATGNTRVVSRQHTSFYHRRSPELEAVSPSPFNSSPATAYTARVQSVRLVNCLLVSQPYLVTPSKLIIIVPRYIPLTISHSLLRQHRFVAINTKPPPSHSLRDIACSSYPPLIRSPNTSSNLVTTSAS